MGYHEQFVYSKSGKVEKLLSHLPIMQNDFDDTGFFIVCGTQAKQNVRLSRSMIFDTAIDVDVNIPKGADGIIVSNSDGLNVKTFIPHSLSGDIGVVDLDLLAGINYSSIFEDKEFTYKGKTYSAELSEQANGKVDYEEGMTEIPAVKPKMQQSL